MSCHRYHFERELSDEEADAMLAEIFGEPLTEPRPPSDTPLDDLFASRSHVRVLRALALHGDDVNLTGRDVARHAEISHTRAQEVLRELVAAAVVNRLRGATWAIYMLDNSSALARLVRAVFAQERQLTSP